MAEILTPSLISLTDLNDYKCGDNDNIRLKEIVKRALLSSQPILRVLDNSDLEIEDENAELDGELYYLKNIFPYYILNNSITNKQHYICYTTSFTEISRYNTVEKYGLLTFYILCDAERNMYEGMPRHDVLGYLIQDIFQWSHLFDTQLKLVSDEETTVDGRYACRTMIFRYTKPNAILQTHKLGDKLVNRIVNKTKGLDHGTTT